MKLELIDQAYNVSDFDNQSNELVDALNERIYPNDETAIHYGFQLALDEVVQHPEMIRPTLYKTMKAIKEKYRHNVVNDNYRQIHAVSIATNHLYRIKRKQSNHYYV